MPRVMKVLAALATLAAAVPASAQVRAPVPGRHAVVVAAESYAPAIGKAPGAAEDARHVADALEEEGFDVQVVVDPGEGALKRSLYSLASRLADAGDGALGVFYFVGQGVQMNEDTLLLPVDARASDDLALSASALSAELITERLSGVRAAKSLIVIDAASPNALAQRFGLRPGLAALDPPPGGLVIFAHYPDRVALPRQPGLSVFARAFAGLVHDRQADFGDAIDAMRSAIAARGGDARSAWVSGDPGPRFTLSARTAVAQAAGPDPGGARAGDARPVPRPAATAAAHE